MCWGGGGGGGGGGRMHAHSFVCFESDFASHCAGFLLSSTCLFLIPISHLYGSFIADESGLKYHAGGYTEI